MSMLATKPFMVEFSGTPEAGKTTTIDYISNKLRSKGHKVLLVKDLAKSLPEEFQKGSFDANLWVHFMTQAEILRALHSDADIVIINRGVIDRKFYAYKLLQENACSQKQYNCFLNTFDKRLDPDLFIALTVTPQTSIKRRGGEGTLVSKAYISQYNEMLWKFFDDVKVPKELVNTEFYTVFDMNQRIFQMIMRHLA